MFRKALLPAVAIALLSGCATDYSYRNGTGDYYYGRPQVEYRYIGGFGSYGGGYGYGLGYGSPVYYYDRFGRLVYGQPYGYYGSPYGGQVPYRPRRPSHGGGGDHHHPGDDNDASDRRPPWRNIGGMRPGTPDGRADAGEDSRPRRQSAPLIQSVPRPERQSAPSMGRDGDAGPRIRPSGGSPRAKAIRASDE